VTITKYFDNPRWHITFPDHSSSNRIVKIVIEVRHAIGDLHHFPFKTRWLSGSVPDDTFTCLGVPQDSIADQIREIEALTISLERVHDSETLFVVAKSRHNRAECPLSGVAKGRMPQIVSHPNRFDEIFVESKRTSDRSSDLGDLQRMRQPGPVMIPTWTNEYLRLVHQSAEALGVDDPVAIPLVIRSKG
jgi:hypothetical protein